MSNSSARELIKSVRRAFDHELVVAGNEADLATRVEAVLALLEDEMQVGNHGMVPARLILRLLNGEGK